jgi:hypothetical protein
MTRKDRELLARLQADLRHLRSQVDTLLPPTDTPTPPASPDSPAPPDSPPDSPTPPPSSPPDTTPPASPPPAPRSNPPEGCAPRSKPPVTGAEWQDLYEQQLQEAFDAG